MISFISQGLNGCKRNDDDDNKLTECSIPPSAQPRSPASDKKSSKSNNKKSKLSAKIPRKGFKRSFVKKREIYVKRSKKGCYCREKETY